MIPQKPYLIRAIYEWALDNGYTPQILATDQVDGVVVPTQYVKDGHIVFNIDPNATQNLQMENEWVMFSARFSGKAMDVVLPIDSVLGIFARENSQGIFFDAAQSAALDQDESSIEEPMVENESKHESDPESTTSPVEISEAPEPKKGSSKKTSPHLKLIK